MASKRIIARNFVLLDKVKRANEVSISLTPAHTYAADTSKGSAAADRLAARGYGVLCMNRSQYPLCRHIRRRAASLSVLGPCFYESSSRQEGHPRMLDLLLPHLTGGEPPSGVRSLCV